MDEITESTAHSPEYKMGDDATLPNSDFDRITMRDSKPGRKRLILSLSVLASFLLGLPFLLKSVEIYRAPLPFRHIDSLANSLASAPLVFPCRFHAVFVGFKPNPSTAINADSIGSLILGQMRELSGSDPVCGTCGNNYTVSVTLDSITDCEQSSNLESNPLWKCGAIMDLDLDMALKDDVLFDEYLDSILEMDLANGGKVYTVVVVKRDLEVRAVVGKHRHAWVIGGVSEGEAAEKVAEIFVKVFVNGGKEEGSIHEEFMPVGADGKVVLSFNLLNADPNDWIYDWDFQKVDEILLAPIIQALGPIASVNVESQVLYHTPKSSFSYWDEELKASIFNIRDLPFFVNSNEWHLDTSLAAGGRSKILHFVVYVPSAEECPLLLQLPDGEISRTNAFISPMWGGVLVWNPSNCSLDSRNQRRRISNEDLQKVFEVFMGQLRQLFGLKSNNIYVGASGTLVLLASERGFTEWELDALSRQHTCSNLLSCSTTLGSLSKLVQSLPRMIIMDEIGKQVKYSVEAANLAITNASIGAYGASAVSSRQARSLAEDAFFHPSIMSVSYYSFEHCFAVYSPFFLPVALHVVLAALREWRRYKQEMTKYLSWKSR